MVLQCSRPSFQSVVLVLTAVLGAGLGSSPAWAGASPHPHATVQALKAHEHHDLESLVPVAEATHRVSGSGRWSSSRIWPGGALPASGDRVWIPAGVRVTVDGTFDAEALDWLRVDGTLAFARQRDTALKVVTLVISDQGNLEIGTRGAPIEAHRRVRIEFADRGPRDRERDPMDLSGGLLAAGRVSIYGAPKTAWVLPASTLLAGQRKVALKQLPSGWRKGDRLLIPGTRGESDEDELRRVASVSRKHGTLTLDQPLEFDHRAPEDLTIPIGNLTRNVLFVSENRKELAARGHVLFMHRQSGTVVDSAAFYGLGRTDTRIPHTVPRVDARGELVAGTDANTQARYALHFHVRSGALRDQEPHRVRGSVIVDSPKHGLVNHGGHVVAQSNVTYRVDGSHFFAENGSEIGAFEGNLAVRSHGSPGGNRLFGLRNRMWTYDFGHGGHGFWSQGYGVTMKGNHAFGHSGAGFVMFSKPIKEGGEEIRFDAANLEDPSAARGADSIDFGHVPFEFYGNRAAACEAGLEMWSHQRFVVDPQPEHRSVVADSVFWEVRDTAVVTTYSHNILFRNVRLYGDPQDPKGKGFGGSSNQTSDFIFENVRVDGFRNGIELPASGVNRISDSYLRNLRNVRVRLSRNVGFDALLENLEFGEIPGKFPINIFMEGWTAEHKRSIYRGDISRLFERARVRVVGTSPQLDGKQIYFLEQYALARPFDGMKTPELAGKNNWRIFHETGLALAGAVAPAGAKRVKGVRGLVGPPTESLPMPALLGPRFSRDLEGYIPRVMDSEGEVFEGPPVDLEEGWNFLPVPARGTTEVALVYGDTTPPRWEPHPGFPQVIHPDDVKYGIRVKGKMIDDIAGLESVNSNEPHVDRFEVTPEGYAVAPMGFYDEARNRGEFLIELRLSDEAPRRGAFTASYLQGFASPEELPRRDLARAISR